MIHHPPLPVMAHVLVTPAAVTVLVLGVMTFVLAVTSYSSYHCTCIYCTSAEVARLDLAYFAYIVQLP